MELREVSSCLDRGRVLYSFLLLIQLLPITSYRLNHFSHFDLTSASRFVIDYAAPPNFRLLVDIQAAIAIPILRSYGEVTIIVNDEGALLKGEIQFLELLNPTVEIKWDVSPCTVQ